MSYGLYQEGRKKLIRSVEEFCANLRSKLLAAVADNLVITFNERPDSDVVREPCTGRPLATKCYSETFSVKIDVPANYVWPDQRPIPERI